MDTRTQTGKWIGIILSFLVLFWFSTQSRATDFSLEGGLSFWEPYPDGVWVQRDYQHKERLKSFYLRASVIQPISTHFSVSAGLFHLGKYSVVSEATSDNCYQFGDHATCPINDTFFTNGSVKGAMATVILHTQNEMFTVGPFNLGQPFVELGVTQYRQKLRLRQRNNPGFDFRGNTMNTGNFLGIGTQYKNWRGEVGLYGIGATYHIDDANEYFPATMDRVFVLSIGRVF